jgi:hypothetical protein
MGRGPDPRRSSHPLTPLFSTGIDRVPAHHSPVASRTLLDIFMRIRIEAETALERVDSPYCGWPNISGTVSWAP